MTVHLMPSEIARLVLGYLKESQCFETEKHFLKESKHLTEYAVGLRHGFNYSTNIDGKSLLDIINGFCTLQQRKDCTPRESSGGSKSSGSQVTDTTKKCTNEEFKRLSQQLSKIETILNKLTQNMTANSLQPSLQTCHQNQYRIIQTSSPLIMNPIAVNESPIVNNIQTVQTPQKTIRSAGDDNCVTPVRDDAIFRTPSRSDAYSPRRKRTPRRLMSGGSTPLKPQSLNSSFSDSCDQTLVEGSSDQLGDASEPLLRIDINEPLVQPEFIVGELLNFGPLHDVLADSINKIFGNISEPPIDDCDQNSHQSTDTGLQNTNDQNIDPQEIRINDDDVNHILANLESAPEYNAILDIITEKELQMTPYKDISSIETNTSSSASSLHTPKTPQIRVNVQKARENSANVVKNLMQELKTPEKTITLYASRSPSNSARITPVKVTPVKVFRSDYIPDMNCVLGDNNVPVIMPKVSVIGEDFNLIHNSLTNNFGGYSVTSAPNQTAFTGLQNRRMGGRKRVDFAKPASELQTKRSELIQRKILPKPTLNNTLNTNRLTTTLIPVMDTNDCVTVPKQPLILVNNNTNPVETNAMIVTQNESQSSEKRLQSKERNNKRHNSSAEETKPHKIRASDVRFPTVNILRKMNASSMNQMLHRIHSKPDNK
ncbi:unnamed protein product [Medioppia subpectinata]|uniref:LisH domain-containing protein n=1 Tax=Medioppia subpectinata TaxID=1979941 RepID=A0A7R9KFX2_9ACAR|nr:unnamed protein product [Medioppia subpectinata]CAG2102819.1 unnamed protein product [Medioppia subpectinata]